MHKKFQTIILPLILIGILIWSCGTKENKMLGATISTDLAKIAAGKKSFELLCSSCHNFKQDAIGPNLSELTHSVETIWIKNFIKGPQKMLVAKDERATELMKKYKALMPDFSNLSNQEIDALLAYLHTQKQAHSTKNDTLESIKDPIKDTVPFSGHVAQIEFFAQIPASQNEAPTARINKLACETNSGRLFVNDLRGFLYELKDGEPHLYLPIKNFKPNFIHQTGLGTGFGSFAFHPEFAENRLFYTTHTESESSKPADFILPDSVKVKFQWVVTEWKVEPDADKFSGSSRELMRFDFIANSHGVQEIAFNLNAKESDDDFGMLYIGLGDGGSVQLGYPKIADHHGTDIWASILRIDPMGNNSFNHNYGIPNNNPFAGSSTLKNEIWAYGFRNPNRFTWDGSGRMLASDIGQSNIEELNEVEPGKFYGWPNREGTFLFNPNGNLNNIYPLPEDDANLAVTYPILQYDHDEGPAISGGFVSKGELFRGKYIFGDISTGKVFMSDLTASIPFIEELKISFENKETTLTKMTGSNRVDLRFGLSCNGDIYILTKANGRIYKLRGF